MIRCVIFDLDGSILNKGILSEANKEALHRMRAHGSFSFPIAFYDGLYILKEGEQPSVQFLKIEIMHCEEKMLQQITDVQTARVMPYNIEITAIGADKGTAALEICRHYNLSADETACFGDSENDIPMLEKFLHSYAADADASLLHARHVCTNCVQDGFYRQIMK